MNPNVPARLITKGETHGFRAQLGILWIWAGFSPV